MAVQLTPYGISNGLAPLDPQGAVNPIAMPVVYDFKNNSVIEKDYWAAQAAGIIGAVQTVYVDNSDNPNPLVFTFQGTGFRLRVPALSSGFFPVVAPTQLRVHVATPADPALEFLQVIYLNVPMPLTLWGPVSVNIANVTATFTPTVGTYVDHSATIAVAATSQQLFAANPLALRRQIMNPSASADSIFVNFGGVAATYTNSIEIMPGGSFDTETGPIDQTQWTIISPSTVNYIAKEMV